jgi:hypothetical protein
MKTKLTILWASATLALAIVNVPAATGQEKAVIKTGRTASVPVQNVQLRADEEEELPDSIIVYSPTDEKMMKQIYLPGESYGQYTWENGAWIFESKNMYMWFLGWYQRGYYNEQTKVSYEIRDGRLYFYLPLGGGIGYLYYTYPEPADTDFSVNYDANGNLTSFKLLFGDGDWSGFIVTYNAGNKPVSVEGRDSYGDFFFKVRYEYNNYGSCTLFESYNRDYEREIWISEYKQISEYDAQDKLLYREYYEDGKMSYKVRLEYYDENYYSSILYTYYDDERNSIIERYEWEYGTDGKPKVCYYYKNDDLSLYAMLYYGDPSGNIPVSESSNVWSSGGQLYIDAATAGAAQIYALSGQLLKTVALTAGQTTATPLPRGVYIVVAGGKTWKVIL